MERSDYIKKIHIAKNKALICTNCGKIGFRTRCPTCDSENAIKMSDVAYRDFLNKLTSSTSCKSLNEGQLAKVADAFDRAGFKELSEVYKVAKELNTARNGTIKHIYGRGKAVLGLNYKKRISGFLFNTVGKPNLYKCNEKELRQVVGWINRLAKYEGVKNETNN